MGDEICLRLYGRHLERVGSFRFLGVYFDTKLTWAEHTYRVVGKCKKVLNVKLSDRDRVGAGRSSLRTTYVALIQSVIDYGSIVCGSAARISLERLDVI